MFWFIVLLLVAGAGFYFYQKLTRIESEIRAEQNAEISRAAAASTLQETSPAPSNETVKAASGAAPGRAPRAEPVAKQPDSAVDTGSEEALALEKKIVAAVVKQPGVRQTELYANFTDLEKKQLQILLKEMADRGLLKREKKGSSYLLFPV